MRKGKSLAFVVGAATLLLGLTMAPVVSASGQQVARGSSSTPVNVWVTTANGQMELSRQPALAGPRDHRVARRR